MTAGHFLSMNLQKIHQLQRLSRLDKLHVCPAVQKHTLPFNVNLLVPPLTMISLSAYDEL